MTFPYFSRLEFLPGDSRKFFSDTEVQQIKDALQTLYTGSKIARDLLNRFFADPSKRFLFFNNEGFGTKAGRGIDRGEISIDLSAVSTNLYITPTGRAVRDSILSTLAHEMIHTLEDLTDDLSPSNYAGDTVTKTNPIYQELGIPLQLSYTGQGTLNVDLKEGYQYTGGQQVDIAAVVARIPQNLQKDGGLSLSTVVNGSSRDLLIGDNRGNKLSSGAGNDFLWGMGDNDILNGGDGIDTAGYSWFYLSLCDTNAPVLRPLREAAMRRFLSQWSW
jgi:hypothetical protein